MTITEIEKIEKNKKLKKMAELGVVRSLPDLMKVKPKPGRLTNKLFQLRYLVDNEFRNFPIKFFENNRDTITKLLNEFGKLTKWHGKEQHIVTIASFCLAILENSESKYPKEMFTLLNDIVDYFERDGFIPEKVFWEGGDAFEKWNNLEIG